MPDAYARIEPAKIGGQGRVMDRSFHYDDETHGGVQDLSFASRCPPDVQPKFVFFVALMLEQY